MKKQCSVLVVLLAICSLGNLYAQKIGLRAGLNFANMLMKDKDETYSDDFNSRLAYHIGPVAEFQMCSRSSLETGILLSSKGYKWEVGENKVTFSPMYFQIPVNVRFFMPVGDMKPFLLAGPYLGYGIGGKGKNENGTTEENDIKWGNDKKKDDLKPLDFGLNFGFGIVLPFGLEANAFYELGLGNAVIDPENGAKVQNRVFGLSLAYKYDLKKK
jgi:hypothetical protein